MIYPIRSHGFPRKLFVSRVFCEMCTILQRRFAEQGIFNKHVKNRRLLRHGNKTKVTSLEKIQSWFVAYLFLKNT